MVKNKNIIIIVIIIILFILIGYFYFNNNSYEEVEFSQEVIESEEENQEKTKNIIVHISGEVKNPGIISLDDGGRVINAIECAGGVTEEADLTNVNLAYELQDGQKIYIPNINDEVKDDIIQENADNIISEEMGKVNKLKIDINKATESELQTLNGIGLSTAQKIIQYRNENGKFKSTDELKNVSGIGESKYEMIKDFICVK